MDIEEGRSPRAQQSPMGDRQEGLLAGSPAYKCRAHSEDRL